MARSARGVSVFLSVALLLPGVGSVVAGGGLTVAVLVRGPVAEGLTWPVKRKVTVAPAGRSTVVARAPVPLLGLLTLTVPPPLLAVAAQVAAVTPAGRGSDTLALVTALGPWLRTTRM